MNICGIVCEYNPFHNGHQYHIDEVRKHADAIVCVMSGNFVQRGEPAILRKHLRAQAAVLSGADLVVELPTPWATASAERFAQGAIYLYSTIPGATHLSFGCESNDLTALSRTAEILESVDFSDRLKESLKFGVSFATARMNSVLEIDQNCGKILQYPNNILAVEYIKALNLISPNIVPIPILRRFSSHDSDVITEDFASASAIRTLIKEQKNANFARFLPHFSEYSNEFENGFAPAQIENAERAILAVLKHLDADDYLAYPDVSEGLHQRIKTAVSTSGGFLEAVEKIKSKRYAHARIRRILLSMFLGITRDILEQSPPYLRVLALNDTGRSILGQEFTIPVITKPASAKGLTGFAKQVFDLECKATELYSLFMPNPATHINEFNTSPIYVPGTHQ